MPNCVVLKKASLILGLLALPVFAGSATSSIAVVLPDAPEPYNQVFEAIVDGIEKESGQAVTSIAIDNKTQGSVLDKRLQGLADTPVIGLGNQAKKLLGALPSPPSIVYGAVFLNPRNESEATRGISLTPSPSANFSWLNRLLPGIKTVHIVYQEKHNGWLVARAQSEAAKYNISVKAHAVESIREAASAFRSIFSEADASQEAIWLLQRDPSVDEKAVVPDILAQAWSRDFVVFSSNPSHVPRGALFALYPDNGKMGASLARMALDKNSKGILPLDDVLIAVNVRTASHVGKNFTRSETKQFDLVFPRR